MDLVTQFLDIWRSPFSSYRFKARLPGHDASVTRLTISSDGIHLASGGSDEVVKVWDLKTLTLTRILRDKHQRWGQITALKWTQDDDLTFLLIGTARGRLAIYSWTAIEKVFRSIINEAIYPENTAIEELDVNLSTQTLIVGSSLAEIRRYKFDKKALSKVQWVYQMRDENGHPPIPRSIHLRRPNEVLIYLLDCGKLFCLDLASGTRKWERSFDTPIGHASHSLDGRNILVDNLSGGFDVYDAATFTNRRVFEVPGKHNHVKDAAFVEGGEVIACPSEDGSIYVFNLQASVPVQVLRHNRGGIRRVAAYGDQERHLIVSASNSKKFDICVWEKLVQGSSSTFARNGSIERHGPWFLHALTFSLILLVAYDKWAPLGMTMLASSLPDHLTSELVKERLMSQVAVSQVHSAPSHRDPVDVGVAFPESLPPNYDDQVESGTVPAPTVLSDVKDLALRPIGSLDSLD